MSTSDTRIFNALPRPCHVNNQGDGLIKNPHSWTNSANIIYLDQVRFILHIYIVALELSNNVIPMEACQVRLLFLFKRNCKYYG